MPQSLASWELDLVLFCIAIRTKALSSRAFAFLGPPRHGLSLALPVWRCLDKILLTSLWPSPNWLTMTICFKPDLRSPITCHLTCMLMGWHLFGGILTNKCGGIISLCQVQGVCHKQLANWRFGRWHVAMDLCHFLSVQWTITITLWQKYSKISVLCADIGNYYNFHTGCPKIWLLWKYAKLLLRCVCFLGVGTYIALYTWGYHLIFSGYHLV